MAVGTRRLARLEGAPTHRLIASRYPTIGPFDYMPDAEAAAAAAELEMATNDRLVDFDGRLSLLHPDDIVVGVPTAHQAMAAFLHASERGGRFNGPDLGAWYASLDIETAFSETLHHHGLRLSRSEAGFPNTIEMRELVSRPDAELVDLRDLQDPAIYDPDDYSAGQALGRRCREERRDGILFRSVRRAGGENVAILKPRLVVPVVQGAHFRYDWDAKGVAKVTRLEGVRG